MRLRCFASGVKVVQSTSHSDAQVAERVRKLVNDKGRLTAAEYAAATKVSLSVGQQQVLSAEELGAVCRDDAFQGLVFYPNAFLYPEDGERWLRAGKEEEEDGKAMEL